MRIIPCERQKEAMMKLGFLSTNSMACSTDSNSGTRSEEHTSELQSHSDLVCRLLLEKKKKRVDRPALHLWLRRRLRLGRNPGVRPRLHVGPFLGPLVGPGGRGQGVVGEARRRLRPPL